MAHTSKITKTREVSIIEEAQATHDFLNAMGYDTTSLTILHMAGLKLDFKETINNNLEYTHPR